MIRQLTQSGVTVFLTTQYLEEADQIADRIALLDHGRFVAEGTAEELKRQVPGGHVRMRFADASGLKAAAAAFATATRDDATLTPHVPTNGSVAELRALLDRLDVVRHDIAELTVHTPDLDDVFLTLTGHPANAEAGQAATPAGGLEAAR